MALSPYEQHAQLEILKWKEPSTGWLAHVGTVINWPLEKAGEALLKTPGVGAVIEKAVGGLVDITNEAAQWSVRPGAVYEEYRGRGHSVHTSEDVLQLDLSHVDRTIGYLGAKYKAISLAEGAGAGAIGLPGIPIDIVALVTLNLRAIGEYAAYCGIDLTLPHERMYAMHLLGLSASPSAAAKGAAMAQLVKIGEQVARKRTWAELEKQATVRAIQQVARALGVRLTKAKLAQIVPISGAVVGGGFNAYFTSRVCDAAYFMYRDRFLSSKQVGRAT